MTVSDAVALAVTTSYRHRCRNVEKHKQQLDAALAAESRQAVKLHRKWAAEVDRCAQLAEFMAANGIAVPETKEKVA